MNYLLCIMASGRPVYLERTLAAYRDFLEPRPAAIYVWDDGLTTPAAVYETLLRPDEQIPSLQVDGTRTRLGRCAAAARCWQAAAESELDWAFLVEEDVVLLRPLDLSDLAYVVDAVPELQQLALVRTPWGAEIEHGGYIPQHPWKYERRWSVRDGMTAEWIASTGDWANSPALFPTRLAVEVDYPEQDGCETLLGARIMAARPGAVSGYWGWGEPWVAHIGVERTPGGKGY